MGNYSNLTAGILCRECTGDVESDVEELEHKKMQEKFDKELQELDKQLLQKEVSC